jgi:NADH-quinone oxidoreductase subunit L
MLLGVLAIIGTPFFSGWYSKERILTTAYGFGLHEGKHILLFVLPVFTAGLTAFYMFRMWFLTFTGKPRDQHLYEKVHESPTIMVLPLAILAFCSLGIAWGWPLWDVEASQLGEALAKAEPTFISSQFAGSIETAHHGHLVVTALALGLAALGSLAAYLLFVVKLEFALAKEANPNWLHNFFLNRWYFDELYDRIFVKPTIVVADDFARMDKTSPGKNPDKIDCTIQLNSLDGWINAIGLTLFKLGLSLRRVQSGSIRRYVLTLVITGGCIFALLSLLMASH